MPTGVVVWNHAIYIRHLPGNVELKPGRNVIPHADWENIKEHPRVRSLVEAGTEGGISLADLRSDIVARIESGEGVKIVNELPIAEAVAYVYGEDDAGRLKDLQAIVRFPQVAVAIQNRLAEIERPKAPVRKKRED